MLWRRTSLALALVFGAAASQAPEFAQQYYQRLGGAIDELAGEVAAFDADSHAIGLSRDQGVAHLRDSGDTLAQGRGERVEQDTVRLESLEQQQQAMRGAAPLSKLRAVLADPDARVAGGAFADYKPGLPLTADGAICAAAGFLGLFGLTRLLALLFRRREKALAKAGAT
jgi:hypothetical protein